MTGDRVEAMRALCADLDASIELARENRVPIRVLELIELAHAAELGHSLGKVGQSVTGDSRRRRQAHYER